MKSSLQQKTKQFMYLDRNWSNIFQFVLIVKINKKNILIIGDHLNIQYCLLRDIINFFVAWQLNLKKKKSSNDTYVTCSGTEQQQVEGNGSDWVNDEPTLYIVERDLLRVSHYLPVV